MSNELSPWLPAVLGLSFGVLVWAILCAIERRKKRDGGNSDDEGR